MGSDGELWKYTYTAKRKIDSFYDNWSIVNYKLCDTFI